MWLLQHHGDKGAVIETAGEVEDGRKIEIALKDVLQRFPHGVAVDVVHGVETQGGAVEVRQDGIVESDVGLLGIEQDPVAIEGYQFDQVVGPRGAASPFFRKGHYRGPPEFLKYYIIRFLSIINAPREKGDGSRGVKSAPGTQKAGGQARAVPGSRVRRGLTLLPSNPRRGFLLDFLARISQNHNL